MNEEVNTKVTYGTSTNITLNDGSTETLYASSGGGGVTALIGENDISENIILVDPNIGSSINVMAVTPAYYKTPIDPANGPRFISTNIIVNVNNVTLHELGHVLYRGKSQDKVLNFDNLTRSIHKKIEMVPTTAPGYDKGGSGYYRKVITPEALSPRPFDETHNKSIR